jgi:hypothetical protein
MPLTSFTVGGVEVNPLLQTFEIRESEGSVSTLTSDITSTGGSVLRFSVHDPVVVQEDGVTIFAGTVTQTRERGFGGPNLYDQDTDAPWIVTTITAEDFTRFADRVYITETVAEGTPLGTFLATLVTYFSGLGVTLHGSQVPGPNLPAMTFTRARGSDVLKALSDATGYAWRIDYDQKLRMWAPGDLTAPFDPDEDDDPAKWTGDVEVERILGDQYANRVTVVSDPITAYNRVESFTGDGVSDTVTLGYTLFAHRGYVTYDGVFQTLTTSAWAGEASWTYYETTNTLVRRDGPIESGKVISITFDGTFQAEATAEDAGEIAANGLYEYVEQRNDITEVGAAEDLAAAILAERLNAGDIVVSYQTRYVAPTLRAGQQQTITAPSRDVSGAHLITDLRVQAETPLTEEFAETSLGLIRRVTAKRNQLGAKWQYTYHDWLSDKTGGTGAQTGTGAAAQVGPSPPEGAVQFYDGGRFGGRSTFVFYRDRDSIVCGGDGSSITAADFASCQVFGSNCHIADPA